VVVVVVVIMIATIAIITIRITALHHIRSNLNLFPPCQSRPPPRSLARAWAAALRCPAAAAQRAAA
jgi:hypothetical protein